MTALAQAPVSNNNNTANGSTNALSATSMVGSFDTQHEDMIHDAQLDYYGKRLVTASSDRTVRIHEVEGEAYRPIHILKGHEGPVWQAVWSHPKFGSLLASCSYDGKVLVWREDEGGVWSRIYEHAVHSASVNAIAFAPHEYGLHLACGSSDGKVSVLSWKDDGTWNVSAEFTAHQAGCNSVSWSPSAVPGSLIQTSGAAPLNTVMRLVTGGSDNLIKIWSSSKEGVWSEQPEHILDGHTDWVRDVAWAPNIGLPCNYIASCSQDKMVYIWTQETPEGQWTRKALKTDRFPEALWRVSWSMAGNLLAVSGGDNKVTLWKQNMEGGWDLISDMEDTNVAYTAGQ